MGATKYSVGASVNALYLDNPEADEMICHTLSPLSALGLSRRALGTEMFEEILGKLIATKKLAVPNSPQEMFDMAMLIKRSPRAVIKYIQIGVITPEVS